MHWIRYGPRAVLIYFADVVGETAFLRGRAIADELERHPPAGLIEYVPAFTSMLMVFDPHLVPDVTSVAPSLVNRLQKAAARKPSPAALHEIPVSYDGPDLVRVAEMHELTVNEVCARHAEPVYRVYMLGFSPGFPYLGELDPKLRTPRLASPRRHVPAGSVAIGGEHTGIYTLDGPGGWNIIGHTTVRLFDPSHGFRGGVDPSMFLLKQGDRVKFVPQSGKESWRDQG